jgi:hypothetical protein
LSDTERELFCDSFEEDFDKEGFWTCDIDEHGNWITVYVPGPWAKDEECA